jgi:outer membrane biogenesis lipoprotein LolB
MPPRSTEKWQAVGKIAVTREGQTETANLQWFRQSAATDRVILTGPIGTGATELRREGNRVYWLDDNEQKPLTALPLASDLTRALNTLPLADLGNWLLGYVPNTGMTALERGSWRVEVQSWQLLSEQRLPRKLLLNYEELQIRVVLLDWLVDDK